MLSDKVCLVKDTIKRKPHFMRKDCHIPCHAMAKISTHLQHGMTEARDGS